MPAPRSREGGTRDGDGCRAGVTAGAASGRSRGPEMITVLAIARRLRTGGGGRGAPARRWRFRPADAADADVDARPGTEIENWLKVEFEVVTAQRARAIANSDGSRGDLDNRLAGEAGAWIVVRAEAIARSHPEASALPADEYAGSLIGTGQQVPSESYWLMRTRKGQVATAAGRITGKGVRLLATDLPRVAGMRFAGYFFPADVSI